MTTPPKLRSIRIQILYGFVAAAVMVVVAVAWYQEKLGLKELSGAGLALFGTFLGAVFAFRLNQAKEDKKIHSERREALNRALFVLARQANAVHQLKSDFDKHTDPIERAFNLPALRPPDYSKVVHNLADLEFLLESPDPNILFQLVIEEERFHQVIAAIETRNEFYVTEFQPKLAEAGLSGKRISIHEARAALGERVLGAVVNGTNVAYEHLSGSETSLPEMQAALLALAKTLYPGTKFITFAKTA